MAVLNKSKEKLYKPIDCIITQNEGKKTHNQKSGIFHPQRYVTIAILSEITINVRQFVYIMTGVKLKKQRQEYSTALYWLTKQVP